MVIFIQATALRYDPDLDFEYLDTSAIYWSMLETGLGFMTANLIIVYSLLAHNRLTSRLRSLGSLLFSKFSRIESQNRDPNFQANGASFRSKNSTDVSTSGTFAGRDIEEIPLDDRHIHMKREYGVR
ncbi:hypothetical protein MMC14_006388 [Varicellaria rhodocarpa]|nr:hypothetical protein [Varicellaria rhodocarpa]